MEWTWREWVKKMNFTEDMLEEIEERLQDSDAVIEEVFKGYETEEEVARAYFAKEGCGRYASIRQYESFYILQEDEEDESSDWMVYEDKIRAMEALLPLEHTLLNSIEAQMETFREELFELGEVLASRIEVEVKREYNNGGHWYSFNLYYRGMFISDGVFHLDVTECQEISQVFESINTALKKEGIFIESIQKLKSDIGFARYYQFEFESEVNDAFVTLTKDIEIKAPQGMSRSILPYLSDLVDEIKEEFQALKVA